MSGPRVITVLAPQVGGLDGISELARQVIGALGAGGDDHRVVVHSLGDAAGPPGLGPVAFVGSGGSRTRFATRVLAAACQASQGDMVLSLHAHLLPLALPFAVRGATIASVIVGVEAWHRLAWLPRLGIRKAGRLIAISHHARARFASANPEFAARDVRICHPAVPALPAPAGPPDADPGFALMVGRLSAAERYKGHDAVLEAWPGVRAVHPGARLVVAGDGDDRTRLEQKARDLGLAGAVVFLGRVDPDALARLYRDAAVFVLPSRDEGFGLVYLEAMRAGLACIGCPGAAAEILAHDRTGVLVPYGDVVAVRDACARLLLDVDRRRRLGAAAAAVVAERFQPAHFRACVRAALGLAGSTPC